MGDLLTSQRKPDGEESHESQTDVAGDILIVGTRDLYCDVTQRLSTSTLSLPGPQTSGASLKSHQE